MNTKICKKCGRELPIERFYKTKSNKSGYMNTCKECFNEYQKQYRQENKEYFNEYYQKNKEYFKEHFSERYKTVYKTPIGRAVYLVNRHKQSDKESNKGECTLTAKWIVDNIFSGQKCIFCGESDWHKLGCDRIDNSKPHTPDNVNPCCEECNKKRGTMDFEEFYKVIKIPTEYV